MSDTEKIKAHLAVMNLALRSSEADFVPRFTSTFELHPSNFFNALPGQLFYSTQIPVCLWFLSKSKAARAIKSSDNSTPVSFRERRRETFFIDDQALISFGNLGVLHSLS